MKQTKRRILVTGAGGSAAYNFIRSLRMAGDYFVVGVDANPYQLPLSNADVIALVPPVSEPKLYIDRINSLVSIHEIDLVHPQPDVEVAFLSENRTKIQTQVYLPTKKTIRIAQDKARSQQIFGDAGVPTARAGTFANREELTTLYTQLGGDGDTLWLRAKKGAGSKAALPIRTLQHAVSWIDYWKLHQGLDYGDFMLSEFLPGKEYAFQSVWKNGEVCVSQARERKAYVFGNLTPSGQSSSPSVAVTVQKKAVNQIATAAVKAIDANATGIFCVDLKENRDGVPCVIEINAGRFFTTSDFFAEAGCNMPDFYVKQALGDETPDYKPYNNLDAGMYWLRMIDMGKRLLPSEDELNRLTEHD